MSSEEQFRSAVESLTENPKAFMNSPLVFEFMEAIRRHLIPNAIAFSQRVGHPYQASDEDDLVNLILVSFASNPEQCRTLAENAASPLAYASTLVRDWISAETGRTVFRTYADSSKGRRIQAEIDHIDSPAIRVPHSTLPDPAAYGTQIGATVDQAIDLTVATLLPRTPAKLAKQLPNIVGWMADNPPARQGHEGERIAEAASIFASVSVVELRAVASITWGGRPNERETSLLGAFLLDAEFNPRASETHLGALRTYQARVRQEAVLAGVSDLVF